MSSTRERAPYGAVKQAVGECDHPSLTVRQLARNSGHSVYSIKSAAKALGVRLKAERRPRGSIAPILLNAFALGLTIPQVAETSGIDRHILYKTATRLGLAFKEARRGPKTL